MFVQCCWHYWFVSGHCDVFGSWTKLVPVVDSISIGEGFILSHRIRGEFIHFAFPSLLPPIRSSRPYILPLRLCCISWGLRAFCPSIYLPQLVHHLFLINYLPYLSPNFSDNETRVTLYCIAFCFSYYTHTSIEKPLFSTHTVYVWNSPLLVTFPSPFLWSFWFCQYGGKVHSSTPSTFE